MSAQPGNLLSQIDDIKGLDAISLFPLAPGWWGLLALAIVAALMVFGAEFILSAGQAAPEKMGAQLARRRGQSSIAMEERNCATGRTAKEVAAALSAIAAADRDNARNSRARKPAPGWRARTGWCG